VAKKLSLPKLSGWTMFGPMPRPWVAESDHESTPWTTWPPEYGEPMEEEAALGTDAPDDDNTEGGGSKEWEPECAGDPSGGVGK
jgi:hypothetical protein